MESKKETEVIIIKIGKKIVIEKEEVKRRR